MKLIHIFLVSLFSISFASAGDLILCTVGTPSHWDAINDGLVSTTVKGPVLLVNKEANKVEWAAAGGFVTLQGVKNQSGVTITKIKGKNPTTEKILSYRESTKFYETYPASYGKQVHLTLKDNMGGTGRVEINLNGYSLSLMDKGEGRWELMGDSSKEKFSYCTTKVSE